MLGDPDWLKCDGYEKALSFFCRSLLTAYYIYAATKFYHVVLAYTGVAPAALLLGFLIAFVMALAAFGALTCPIHPYFSNLLLWLMKLPAAYLYAETLHVPQPRICACILLAGDVAATLLAISLAHG